MDEIEAAWEQADRWGRYVAAHAYSAEAVKRAVTGGVRTIEHGNLIDRETAVLMAARGAFMVPTLVAYDAMPRRPKEFGMAGSTNGRPSCRARGCQSVWISEHDVSLKKK